KPAGSTRFARTWRRLGIRWWATSSTARTNRCSRRSATKGGLTSSRSGWAWRGRRCTRGKPRSPTRAPPKRPRSRPPSRRTSRRTWNRSGNLDQVRKTLFGFLEHVRPGTALRIRRIALEHFELGETDQPTDLVRNGRSRPRIRLFRKTRERKHIRFVEQT